MAKSKNRREKREITPAEKTEVALRRFAPLREGKSMTSISDLVDIFGRDGATISRMISSAFEEGLVDICQSDTRRVSERDHHLEDELVTKFEGLTTAIVVKEQTPSSISKFKDQGVIGDEMHEVLGRAMADFISQKREVLFRPGDRIGCGSGRGPWQTCAAIDETVKFRVPDVTLQSLTGIMYVANHSKRIGLHLDADEIVNLLSTKFEHNVRQLKVSHRIAYEDSEKRNEVMKKVWWDTKSDDWIIPDVALAGCGTLGLGHRLFQAAKPDRDKSDDERDFVLNEVIPDAEQLLEACNKLCGLMGIADFCPVGDICNHLFYIPHPNLDVAKGPSKETKALIAEIEERVDNLNSRLLTFQKNQLQRIKSIMMVAGTEQKAWAVHKLLSDPAYKIRILCTDNKTARKIVELGGE